ncbi:MAG TPA: hypothetical protein VGD67_01730, partial [Pseudonocardiaceae bacterium]
DRGIPGGPGGPGGPGVAGIPGGPGVPGGPGGPGAAHRAADPDATTVMPKVPSEALSGRTGPKWPEQPPDSGR